MTVINVINSDSKLLETKVIYCTMVTIIQIECMTHYNKEISIGAPMLVLELVP